MKKIKLKIFVIIAVVLIIPSLYFGSILIPKIIKYHFVMLNEYDEIYNVQWFSGDKKISFINNNIKGIYGEGRYNGKYIDKDVVYNIKVVIDYNYFSFEYNNEIQVRGSVSMNYLSDTCTLFIKDVNSDIFDYKSGDSIVLMPVNN